MKNPEIVLTSTSKMKVYINTDTICAYWQVEYKDVNGNGYSCEIFTDVLFTNGKTYSYIETPETIHDLIYGKEA